MELFTPGLEAYAERFTSSETSILKEIASFTQAHTSRPHMMSGHLQGVFLSMISRMIKPKYVLEIGTFTGYSAICLATGLQPGGYLITIDRDERLHTQCKAFFQQAGLAEVIRPITGDALYILQDLDQTFDLVFIDADKENYITYYETILPRVATGGWILADNVLFHGEVLQPIAKQSKPAQAIQAFNQHIAADNRVEHLLLTIRDGLMLIRKK
ncbi:MAG: class I SAM-dependent methyltransferase [Thermoflavifilum sp.]|nr:class I SAM-dependent methyltransferase [Thermoflavifilum sp.]